jgi:hypothetical protein
MVWKLESVRIMYSNRAQAYVQQTLKLVLKSTGPGRQPEHWHKGGKRKLYLDMRDGLWRAVDDEQDKDRLAVASIGLLCCSRSSVEVNTTLRPGGSGCAAGTGPGLRGGQG